jgi:hypothetical protein
MPSRHQGRPVAAVGEDALAPEFAELHDGHFVYAHTAGAWFRWNMSRRIHDDTSQNH